jgi:hypothetical protein
LAAAILAASVVVVAVTWAVAAVVATGKLLRLPRATKKARLLRQAGLFCCVNNKRIPILQMRQRNQAIGDALGGIGMGLCAGR